jgi:hypothetical protein
MAQATLSGLPGRVIESGTYEYTSTTATHLQGSIPLNDTYDPEKCYPRIGPDWQYDSTGATNILWGMWAQQDFANDQIDFHGVANTAGRLFRIKYEILEKPIWAKLYQATHYVQPGGGANRSVIITPSEDIRNPAKCLWVKHSVPAYSYYDWNGTSRQGYQAAGNDLTSVGDGTFRWNSSSVAAAAATAQWSVPLIVIH